MRTGTSKFDDDDRDGASTRAEHAGVHEIGIHVRVRARIARSRARERERTIASTSIEGYAVPANDIGDDINDDDTRACFTDD